MLDRERANDQSHATGLRLTRTRGQKLNESEGTKDLTQSQTQDKKKTRVVSFNFRSGNFHLALPPC